MSDDLKIVFHSTEGHETCEECGASLWHARGRGVLMWLCLFCREVTFEED